MTDQERLAGIEFVGIQYFEMCDVALFNDPLTGSTITLLPGETIGARLARLDAQREEALTQKTPPVESLKVER